MSEHTPTPWQTRGMLIISEDTKEYLADCETGDVDSEKANTDFVVLAVNAHDALVAACEAIEDGPDDNCAEIHLTDNYQQGLFCGLEDRDIVDRYDACMYGFEKATERVIEWAKGMVEAALAAVKGE